MFRKFALVVVVVCAFAVVANEGRRVLLRPISTVEVQRLLRQANREDAVPEGRVISHGLAAIKGFALGLKKGVLGVAIVDGLAALSLSNTTSSSNSSSSSTTYNKPSVSYNGTTNEICFTSRSATSDIYASGEAEERSGIRVIPTTATGTTTGTGTGSVTGTGSGTNTGTTTNTATTTTDNAGTVSCISLNKS